VFEVRVYDKHGNLKETVHPEFSEKKSWFAELGRKDGYLEPYECAVCGKKGFKSHPTRLYCDKCKRKRNNESRARTSIKRKEERERLKKLKAEREAKLSKG
jgi:hypothetical protein